MSNMDSGLKDKIIGKAKEVEGKLTGDKSREVEGKLEEINLVRNMVIL